MESVAGVPGGELRLVAARLGFLADAYDIFAIDIVSVILKMVYGVQIMTDSAQSLVTSSMLAGLVVGQLTFGTIADLLGRKWTSVATAALTVLGAIASALVVENTDAGGWGLPVYLAVCRFCLGLGVGGEYPLTATISAEAAPDVKSIRPYILSVGSMQGFGMLLSSFVALVALTLQAPLEVTWRLMLAFGALPSAVALFLRWQMHESDEYVQARADRSTNVVPLRTLWWPLIGTAVPWFLMNAFFYTLGLFKSTILAIMFPSSTTSQTHQVVQLAEFSVITSIFAIAGFGMAYFLIVFARVRSFTMQLYGFVVLAALFVLVTVLSSQPTQPSFIVFLVCFGLLFFFNNCGPNLSTFMIPAEVFPTLVRARCHGLSAACGKVGAFIGAATFTRVSEAFGMSAVYGGCAILALAGALVTYVFTPRHVIGDQALLAEAKEHEGSGHIASSNSSTAYGACK